MASKKKGQVVKEPADRKGTVDRESKKASFSPSEIKEFVYEVQAEFKKVVWPDKKVTVGLTGLVLLLVVILSIYLGSVDMLLGKLVSLVLQ